MLIVNILNLFISSITIEILILRLLIYGMKNINYIIWILEFFSNLSNSMINNPIKIFKPQEEGYM